ncbi:hypothetical protein [Burkholderia gladioli]|uniref:hypothetical protein n=1 Tax=Burkholderia gladioli TaxID=28095 RepID=UPI0016411B80|nr:hypothetical protein [Burkholderia gladioli]
MTSPATVTSINSRLQPSSRMAAQGSQQFDGGGGSGHDGGMETRIAALEAANLETRDRLTRIETRLDAVATKADLHEALHALTWKIISACAGLVAVAYFIAKYVH